MRKRDNTSAQARTTSVRHSRRLVTQREDGTTRLIAGFTAKGPGKSQVALSHERVPDAEVAAELKAYWRERLGVLKALLEER